MFRSQVQRSSTSSRRNIQVRRCETFSVVYSIEFKDLQGHLPEDLLTHQAKSSNWQDRHRESELFYRSPDPPHPSSRCTSDP